MDIFSLVQTVCAQFMQWSLAMYDEQYRARSIIIYIYIWIRIGIEIEIDGYLLAGADRLRPVYAVEPRHAR